MSAGLIIAVGILQGGLRGHWLELQDKVHLWFLLTLVGRLLKTECELPSVNLRSAWGGQPLPGREHMMRFAGTA